RDGNGTYSNEPWRPDAPKNQLVVQHICRSPDFGRHADFEVHRSVRSHKREYLKSDACATNPAWRFGADDSRGSHGAQRERRARHGVGAHGMRNAPWLNIRWARGRGVHKRLRADRPGRGQTLENAWKRAPGP